MALVDDTTIMALVEHGASIRVVGEASDGSAALHPINQCRPDIMILDGRLGHNDDVHSALL